MQNVLQRAANNGHGLPGVSTRGNGAGLNPLISPGANSAKSVENDLQEVWKGYSRLGNGPPPVLNLWVYASSQPLLPRFY
jgi:hypothetical protein